MSVAFLTGAAFFKLVVGEITTNRTRLRSFRGILRRAAQTENPDSQTANGTLRL
jgi:hypothetical protein